MSKARIVEVTEKSGCYEIKEEPRFVENADELGKLVSESPLMGWGSWKNVLEVVDTEKCPGVDVTRYYFKHEENMSKN